MKTLDQLLHIAHPIIQAPMAGAQGSAMAIAVSNAGALGSLPAAMLSPQALEQELTTIQAHTSRPYNVNFFCHTPAAPDPDREARWRQTLAPYYAEFGLYVAQAGGGPNRAPFSREVAALVERFKPPVVSFHFGLPDADLVSWVKRWGARVMSSATTVEEARWLEAHGADIIIAQGVEAGGHRGMFLTDDVDTQIGTFALVPQVVQAVKVPVVAAGGIADADGIAAALALGAAGAQLGTAFLLTPESTITALHRQALQMAQGRTTALTNLYSGRPARGLTNRLMRELGPISPLAPEFPTASAALAPLRAAAEQRGDEGFSPLWCGQNPSGCLPIAAAELVARLAHKHG